MSLIVVVHTMYRVLRNLSHVQHPPPQKKKPQKKKKQINKQKKLKTNSKTIHPVFHGPFFF